MIRRAYAHTCPHCGGCHTSPDLSDDSSATADQGDVDLSRAYLNVIKTVFKGSLNDNEIDEKTTLENAQTFMKGIFEGYGQDFETVKWNSPDYHKLLHLEQNVYSFSGAKNWQMLRDLTDAIKEGDVILPYRQFRTKALSIIGEYQGAWLQTEYNAAIAGAQMAGKWVDYSAHPNALLEYRTIEDTRVRPEHAELNGITRPVDDKFWDTYYPPNGWNCRCTTIRLNDGAETKKSDLTHPDIPRMFQVNLGKEGLVFPKSSPYYIGVPKQAIKQAIDLIPDHSKP